MFARSYKDDYLMLRERFDILSVVMSKVLQQLKQERYFIQNFRIPSDYVALDKDTPN